MLNRAKTMGGDINVERPNLLKAPYVAFNKVGSCKEVDRRKWGLGKREKVYGVPERGEN